MGRIANEVGQNTSNGPVARINAMGTLGILFDPINSSNMQTGQKNVGIGNAFKGRRDDVKNQHVLINLNALRGLLGRTICTKQTCLKRN